MFTHDEVLKAINMLKKGRSGGKDALKISEMFIDGKTII